MNQNLNVNVVQQRINQLLLEDQNKHCANCTSNDVEFVCLDLGTLICRRCSEIHRQLKLKLQNIDEIDQNFDQVTEEDLQKLNGNKDDNNLKTHKWIQDLDQLPNEQQSTERVKEFIAAKLFECLVAENLIPDPDMNPQQTEVDLFGRSLTVVPNFFGFILLKKLNLSWNKFESSSNLRQIFLLPKLSELFINQCNISQIKAFNTSKSQITVLVIDYNALQQETAQMLCTLPLLENMNMQNCSLKRVPRFPQQSRVSYLNLSYNLFEDISDLSALLTLQSLLYIDIVDCNIEKICEINDCDFDTSQSKLQELDISSNKLDFQSVNIICNIPRMEQLIMDGCQLSQALKFSRGQNLKFLGIQNNLFNACGDSICELIVGNLPNLETLRLESSKLTHLPNLSPFQNLTSINFCKNRFDNVKNWAPVFLLPKLEQLGLSWCFIQEIDDFDTSKCNLIKLHASFNNLCSRALSLLGKLPLLQLLDIASNDLVDDESYAVILGNESLLNFTCDYFDYNLKKGGMSLLTLTVHSYDEVDYQPDVSWLPYLDSYNENVVQQRDEHDKEIEHNFRCYRSLFKTRLLELPVFKREFQVQNQRVMVGIRAASEIIGKCCEDVLYELEQ